MKLYEEIGTGIFVHEKVKIGKNVTIGHCSCIGFGDPEDGALIIEDNVSIGAFCVIHFGATIRESVSIDHNCVIGSEVEIGKNTKILSGKEITDKAKVGENCVIGGHVPDRTIIEDDVTFMGEIAHSHRDASLPWDDTIEPSPTIYKGSFIGVNALIIGSVEIGPCAFIGAGEIVRVNVGKRMAYMKGTIRPLEYYKGTFNSRCK
jgi:UDP-3-O-[3-hydroxymyristoyl] glucosamine N-acyltransferase